MSGTDRSSGGGGLPASCLPVPVPGPGVCPACSAGTLPGERLCSNCRRHARVLGEAPPLLTPVSLVTAGSPLYAALCGYKAGHPEAPVLRARLASLLAAFLRRHLACLAPGGVDTVVTVPSMSGRRGCPHPLDDLVGRIAFLPPALHCLEPGRGQVGHRRADPAGLRATTPLGGRRVLLVDDTCTTGAHVASAARALRRAGAAAVHPVVIGRYLQAGWPPSDILLARAAARGWRAGECVHCAGAAHHAPPAAHRWAIMAAGRDRWTVPVAARPVAAPLPGTPR